MPAGEVHRRLSGVLDLNPVGRIAIAIAQGVLVAGHELGDDDTLGRRRGRPCCRGREAEKHEGGA